MNTQEKKRILWQALQQLTVEAPGNTPELVRAMNQLCEEELPADLSIEVARDLVAERALEIALDAFDDT